jgi:hypothetical protein
LIKPVQEDQIRSRIRNSVKGHDDVIKKMMKLLYRSKFLRRRSALVLLPIGVILGLKRLRKAVLFLYRAER